MKKIDGRSFTLREIEVIAFVCNMRGTGKIASTLLISAKTVESHIRNIMLKIGCNSREGIIDFVHNARKTSLMRVHYQKLLDSHSLSSSPFVQKEIDSAPIDSAPIDSASMSSLKRALSTIEMREIKKKFFRYIPPLFFGILILFSFFFWKGQRSDSSVVYLKSVRSEFLLPGKMVFLPRPQLFSKIDESFKGKEPIQTLVLTGIGGAGKTTLAHCYAREQNSPLVWSINAESKAQLFFSFERLADSLSQTEETQKKLQNFKEIEDAQKKEEKLILFVKEQLKSLPEWFLIYDNVRNFTDIQRYFPCDHQSWGRGKVIVTSRNNNIRNNHHIQKGIVVGELDPREKLLLFTKILRNEKGHMSFDEQQKFLKELPPSP